MRAIGFNHVEIYLRKSLGETVNRMATMRALMGPTKHNPRAPSQDGDPGDRRDLLILGLAPGEGPAEEPVGEPGASRHRVRAHPVL